MKITGESIKQPKKRGEWAELRFMARAAEHGLSISKPWGESCRYDFIVEHAGKFLRVQVKSTVCRKRHSYAYHVNGRSYTKDEIDFFAIYIIPQRPLVHFPGKDNLKVHQKLDPLATHESLKARSLHRSLALATRKGARPAVYCPKQKIVSPTCAFTLLNLLT